VKVLKHDAVTVTILDEEGGASVPLEKLPANLQKQFDYDPVRAREQVAASEQKAAQEKKEAAASKPTVTLIGTIVDARSNGYYIEVALPHRAGKPETYSEAHHGMGAVPRADHDAVAIANVVGPGTYFLETKNLYLTGQRVGMVVYAAGNVPDYPFGSVTVFTNDPNVIPVAPATKLVAIPPILNQVILRPGATSDSFNPGSMKDNVLDNSATSASPSAGGFSPGSLQTETVQ
jgi:hypothetical protein